MAKRRGNPNWGKPEPIGPVVPTVTSFEQVVKEFKLTPDQYNPLHPPARVGTTQQNSKYIPRRCSRPGDSRSSPCCKICSKLNFEDSKQAPPIDWRRFCLCSAVS